MTIIDTAPDPWLSADGRIDLDAPGVVRPYRGPGAPDAVVIVEGAGQADRLSTPVGRAAFGPVARRLRSEPDGGFLCDYAERAARTLGVERVAVVVRDLGVHGVLAPGGRVHATYASMMWAPYGFADEPWPGCYATIAAVARRTELGLWFGSVDRVNHGTLASPDIRWLSAPGSVARVRRAIGDLAALGIRWFGLDNLSGAEAVLDQPPGQVWADGVAIPAPGPTHAPGTVMVTPARAPGVIEGLIGALREEVPDAVLIGESLLSPGRAIYEHCAGMRMLCSAAAPMPGRQTATRLNDVSALLADAWMRERLSPGVPIYHLLTGDGWTAEEVRHGMGMIGDMPGRACVAIDWWTLALATGVRPID